MPKKLLPILGGMVLVAVVAVAGLLAFILPPDVLGPTVAERAAEAEADQESQGDENLGEASDPQEGAGDTQSPEQEGAEDAPGGGDGQTPDTDAGSGSEAGGQDTGDVQQEQQEQQDESGDPAQSPGA